MDKASSNKFENISNMTLPVARAGVDVQIASAAMMANDIVVKPDMKLLSPMRRSLIELKTFELIKITLLTEPLLNLSTACSTATGQFYMEAQVKRYIF